jgi:hypothetical protein
MVLKQHHEAMDSNEIYQTIRCCRQLRGQGDVVVRLRTATCWMAWQIHHHVTTATSGDSHCEHQLDNSECHYDVQLAQYN